MPLSLPGMSWIPRQIWTDCVPNEPPRLRRRSLTAEICPIACCAKAVKVNRVSVSRGGGDRSRSGGDGGTGDLEGGAGQVRLNRVDKGRVACRSSRLLALLPRSAI